MRPGRGTMPMLAVLLAAVLAVWGVGCRMGASPGHEGAPPEASFAAATQQQGRSPLDLSLATGKAVYDHYCAICHGETGGGDGFNSYNVKETYGVTPTAFTDSTAMASLKDSEALTAIRKGGLAVGKSAAMPPWGHTLTPGEVADVWQYARSLAEAAQKP